MRQVLGASFAIFVAVSLAACADNSAGVPAAEPALAVFPALAINPSLISLANAAPGTLGIAERENLVGAATFRNTCALCHSPGIAGAPRLSDGVAWAERLARGRETLHAHAIQGFRGERGHMPARGGNPSLSDEEVRAAVDYMMARAAAPPPPKRKPRKS